MPPVVEKPEPPQKPEPPVVDPPVPEPPANPDPEPAPEPPEPTAPGHDARPRGPRHPGPATAGAGLSAQAPTWSMTWWRPWPVPMSVIGTSTASAIASTYSRARGGSSSRVRHSERSSSQPGIDS